MKNQRGLNALSFNKQTISDPLSIPVLSAKIQSATSIQLTWKNVSNTISYQVEIKDLQADKYTSLRILPKETLTFLVDNLAGNTNYTFRVKAMANGVESEYSIVQIQTPKALDLPNLTAFATGIESVKLSWKAVNEAVNYIIERKNLTSNSFELIAKVEANIFEFSDKPLVNSTLYSYRIKAIGAFTESPYATVEVKTLVPLQSPDPTLSILYYNSLKVNWKAVQNSNSFILERKAANQDYKVIGTFEPTVLTFTDKALTPNTRYTYRIKAIGGITESLWVTVEGTTPTLLSIPELTITSTSYDALKITWKPSPNATQYVLEKKNSESEDYKELTKLEASATEFADISLKEKSTYFYRLKAYGDKTESDFSTAKGTTATILGNEEEIYGSFELFPNPSNTQITLRFSKPMSGQISLVDLRGVEIFSKDILKINELVINLNNYQSGSYIFNFKNEDGIFSKKLIIN